jgi:hypothetical protein
VTETGAVGEQVAGRYRVLNEVGRGGMATVYRAHDEQLDRDVALKFVDAGIASDEDFSAALTREARAAAALAGPHIVTIYDVGEHEGRPYIVMEFVEGGDLRSILRAHGRLSAGEAARIGLGIARGLAALHARGLVHCDVKPLNVLLTGDGSPKLTDFGIARAAAATGALRQEEIVGSVPYLSPEQLKGERIGPRTDVYALGIVLYELLTGAPPFAGSSFAQIAAQRLHSAPPPVGDVVNGLPPALTAVIERALALDPTDRFTNAAEMAEALAPLATSPSADAERSDVRGARPSGDLHGQSTRLLVPARAGADEATASGGGRVTVGLMLARFFGPLAASIGRVTPRSARLLRAPLLIAAVLLVALAAIRFSLSASSVRAESVVVPSLAGMSFGDAVQQIEAAGLQASKADERITLDTPRDVVVTQEPPAGQSLKKGEQVRLTVSLGVSLPNFVGQHWDDVKPWMDQNGWRLGGARFVFANQADFGKVLIQEPSAESGPVVDKAVTAINLTIAGPPEATRTGFPKPGPAAPPAVQAPTPALKAEPTRGESPPKAKRGGRDDDD